MQTATEVMQQIQEAAVTHTPAIRTMGEIAIGEKIRQGDIYVWRVAPGSKHTGSKAGTRQLAPGNTKGSRHIVEGDVEIYKREGDATVGPLVIAAEPFTVTHPEHGHFVLPAGTYEVTYQRDYARDRADEIRRVAD